MKIQFLFLIDSLCNATITRAVKQAALCVVVVSSRYCHSRCYCIAIFCVIAILAASPRVLFLRHALFSVNAVPLRDTSHVSRVTLCRFHGTSYYIGVISCLVTSPSARFLSVVVPQDAALIIPFSCRLRYRSQHFSSSYRPSIGRKKGIHIAKIALIISRK